MMDNMDANPETLSQQKQPDEPIKGAQHIEPTEKKELPKRIKQTQKLPKLRGRPRKDSRTLNFLKKGCVSRDTSPRKPLEPPEQWTTCRLRQNGRDLVRNRITAEAEYELSVQKEITRKRNRIANRRPHQLSKPNSIAEFSFVKVEEVNEITRERLSQQNGFSDLSSIKVEPDMEYSSHEEISTESATGGKIKKGTKFDVVCNLIHSICKKLHCHHSQHNRLQNFDNRSMSRSSNYILSAVAWHKLNECSDESPIRTEQLSEQNGFAEFTFVKVEEDHQIAEECAERLSEQNKFVELNLMEQQLDAMNVTVEDCGCIVKGRGRTRIATARRRAKETEAQRFARLEHMRRRREAKSDEERFAKLERMRRRCETETDEEKLKRQKIDRAHRLLAETYEERSMRVERKRMVNLQRREMEAEEERVIRLERCRLKRRETETIEQRSLRLERTRIARERRLAEETEEQRFARLERGRRRLETETDEERSVRLERLRSEMRRRREAESYEERFTRLERIRMRRETETDEERSVTLERLRRRRETETEKQKLSRVESQRIYRAHRILAETDEERSIRLERIRMANLQRREMETEEERSIRLERYRIENLKRREMETAEQRSIRIERKRRADKLRYLKKKNAQQEMIEEDQ